MGMLADEIRMHRAKKKLSQKELGALLGCSASFICSIESDVKRMPDAMLERLLMHVEYPSNFLAARDRDDLDHLVRQIKALPLRQRELLNQLINED